MFSDHLPKIVESPAKTLMFVAAGLGIVGQLVALVMLADGQVEKAQLRDASQATPGQLQRCALKATEVLR